ncbi:MAG: inositol monophosphatase family protein [Planctomycetota bacterium]|nr:inositol monophosphatase family protein [Planctomycetota bacterium]
MSGETEFLVAAQEAALAAGRILEEWGEKFTVSEKGPADLVTEADVAAQNAIFALLQQRFPEHGFLGEEGLKEPSGAGDFRWIIDPLDGTSNYVHRFPYYCVSIALEQAGELITGVIYDPTRKEMFAAEKGRGATVNGKPLKTSRFSRLKDSMVIASFPPGVKVDSVPIRRFLHILEKAQTVHRSGSAALNLAYVAAGRLDGYWSTSLKAWDMAAGALIVAEAGGKVTKMSGASLDLSVQDMLATNGTAMHAELSRLLGEVE